MRPRLALYLIYSVPVPLLLASIFVGPADTISINQVLAWLNGSWRSLTPSVANEDELVRTIVWDVRLPRIVLTFLVGAALSGSGNALQALFRNPLVDPYLLGLSSGSAFGAALALTTSWMPLQLSAFAFGVAAVFDSVTGSSSGYS